MTIYDPLKSKTIPSNQPAINSYWQDNYQLKSTQHTDVLNGDIRANVVIIGAGYTGLNCAINLALSGIKDIVIVDANDIGWGCSGRNAGFVLPGSGRLSYQQLVNKFGMASAQSLHNDYLHGIKLVADMSNEHDIGRSEMGYLKLAHSAKWFDKLKASGDFLHHKFNFNVEQISKQDFQHRFVDHKKVYGAIRYESGFGIHPLKLVDAYAKKAMDLGVKIYTNSAVNSIRSSTEHQISTQNGSVTGDKLVLATNGYTPAKLDSVLKSRILPVLTSVIVTEPLTQEQLVQSNFVTQQVMMDTRNLKYYYRLLPGNRILFGGRGAISGSDAKNPIYANRLLKELHRSFPTLSQVKIDYNWHGWISVSLDQMPHIYKTPNEIYYATGYCGSGVSFTALAGKQLADLVLDKGVNSPLISKLPYFPFAPFRRLGQRLFYQVGRIKDAWG